MLCKKCGKESIKRAVYCKYCGHKFTKKEKEMASEDKLESFVSKVQGFKDKTIYKIFSSIYFKVISVLLILTLIACFSLFNRDEFGILESNQYEVKYNQELNEYYLYLDRDSYVMYDNLLLNIYVPKNVSKFNVDYFSSDGKLIKRVSVSDTEDLYLEVNKSDNSYYVIYADEDYYGSLKVYVYLGGE